MLKYTSVVNEDGIASPSHNAELDYIRNTPVRNSFNLSAETKPGSKMAIKRRGKKLINTESMRANDSAYLPPISHSTSPQAMTVHNNILISHSDRRDKANQPIKRKEIRTPYVSHMAMSRANDVVTPYVLHTNISNIDSGGGHLNREHTKLSGNVVEYKHDADLKLEATFTSLTKLPTTGSPGLNKRPSGRHGRYKNSSFNENDFDRGDMKDLTIQSNQMGLYKRADRRLSRENNSKGKGDEAISIRKKIEQFRRWHEEQYKEKIKKLKQEVDHQFEAEHTKVTRHIGQMRETPTSKNQSAQEDIEKVPSEASHEKMDDEKGTPNFSNETSKDRTESARTWHTWRDVNDSYAYSDVHKYIKDNELMDDEKSSWIKKWVIEVNRSMRDQQETIL